MTTKSEKKTKPTLAEVEEAVSRYERLKDELTSMPASATFGWLSVDCSPIRASLLSLVRKCRFTLCEQLQSKVQRKLDKFLAFVHELEEKNHGQ